MSKKIKVVLTKEEETKILENIKSKLGTSDDNNYFCNIMRHKLEIDKDVLLIVLNNLYPHAESYLDSDSIKEQMLSGAAAWLNGSEVEERKDIINKRLEELRAPQE